jgi:hypothetical protein
MSPKLYEIKVQGHLEKRRIQTMEHLTVQHNPNGQTVLLGTITDQAALYGLLNRLRDLGIPLVSVNTVEVEATDSTY